MGVKFKPEYFHFGYKGEIFYPCQNGYPDLKRKIEEDFNLPFDQIVEKVVCPKWEFFKIRKVGRVRYCTSLLNCGQPLKGCECSNHSPSAKFLADVFMSKWTHSICTKCYEEQEPDRVPSTLLNPDVEACCKCGQMHSSGIYYRADPEKMLCKGKHD